jgi:hypothetical protein
VRKRVAGLLLFIPTTLLIPIGAGVAGPQAKLAVSKAYLDSNNNVHIAYSDGEEIQPPPDKGQVSCESLKVAEDKEATGWLVDFDNDGATYPVAMTLVVFRDRKVLHRFGGSDVDIVGDWQFWSGGKQVAFVTNAFHGGGRAHYELHDVEKGTLLAKWEGPLTAKSPAWTRGLWDEDAE